jgi:hypothetical protein
MKKLIKILGSVLLSTCLSGCVTQQPEAPIRTDVGGRNESYVGSKEQIDKKIQKYGLRSWTKGNDVYAEGRTYGVHFAEYSTSTNLLDGCATDGFTKE